MMYHYASDKKHYGSNCRRGLLQWLLLCAILAFGVVSTEALAQGNVQGIKFNDANANGVYDFGENTLANWVICAYNPATGTLVTTLTNTAGQYIFTGLSNGTWLIYEDQLSGWTQTTPGSVFYTENVVSGMTTIGRDFGNAWICSNPLATTIPAGLQDNFLMPTEPASASPALRAFLTTSFTWPVREFFDYGGTNHSFGHSFTNLLGDNNGCYIVSARLEIRLAGLGSGNPMDDMIGFVQGGQAVWSSSISALYGAPWIPGAQNTFILDLDNLPASASGITNILAALRDGTLDVFVQNNTSVDYMILQLEYCCNNSGTGSGPTLEGTKYNDLNGNGVRDPGEPGLAGWVISAYHNPSGQTVSATTDSSGNYILYLPISGEWVVYENQQPGWTQTAPAEVVHVVAPDSPPIVTGLDFGNIVVCPDPSTSSVTVGVDDDFDTGNGNEYTSPSSAFATYMYRAYKPGSSNLLDGSGLDKSIGHTFTGFLPPGCIVTGARLTIKIRANGGGSGNDLIAICADEVNAWAGFITDIVGYSWTTGSVDIITLDLANLPGTKVTNVLGALQDGDFDFFIQDDTGIDYAVLEVDYCCSSSSNSNDTLQGTKYNDLNGNGMRDPGEPGLAGWVIGAYQNPTGQTTTATTDASGNYTLYLPISGEWVVYENQQPGWTQTAPAQVVHVVTTASGSVVTGLDFGNIEVCSNPATSSVTVGEDDNFGPDNGNEYTAPSSGLYGYMNAAYTNGNTNLLDDTGTDRVIGHTFTGFLSPGCIVTGARLTMRLRANGSGSDNDLIAFVADEVNVWAGFISNIVGYSWSPGSVDVITLDLANLPGTTITNVLGALQDGDFDFFMQDDTGIDYATLEVDYCCSGNGSGNSIQGMKFYDSNHNGINDPGEAGLSGWVIEAFDPVTGQIFNATTDGLGNYSFPSLSPGTWMIYEVQQPGWTQTYPQSVFHTVTVVSGLTTIGVDFGNTEICPAPASTTYNKGIVDNFTGGVKPASPDPALTSFLGTLGGPVIAYYDLPLSIPSHAFGETVGNLVPTGCYLTGAYLTIRLGTTANSGSIDDVIGFVQNGQEIWRQRIATLAGVPWISTQTVLTLDLSALPLPLNGSNVTNILAALQDGTLDIFIHNNTRVDYIDVTVEYCCPPMQITPVEEATGNVSNSTYASPNPFAESTDLTFTLPAAAPAQVVIYDVYGNTIRTLNLGERNSGIHTVRWDGRDQFGMLAANGMYLYQIEASGFRYTGKVLLQR